MRNVITIYNEFIFLAENVQIHDFGHLTAHEEAPITIGKNTLIGPFVMMNSNNHKYKLIDKLICEQGHTRLPIVIGEDVWIGGRVSILYGSTIPDKCVIGANSLVTRHSKLEKGGVYIGSPVRLLKRRT